MGYINLERRNWIGKVWSEWDFYFWLKVIGSGKLKGGKHSLQKEGKKNCKNNVAKLIDFSLSMSIPKGQLHVQVFHICGKHGYAMPKYARMGYLIENADTNTFGRTGFMFIWWIWYEAYNLDCPMLWHNATERIILNVPGERDV